MDAVKSFNAELSSLYEVKPPISKAKMTAITRGAIKAIKFYKHVVQSVEKFILKCKAEYKVPGLYVIDSIVRQSRHQFGADKDVFAPRFSKNMQHTFVNLFKCPPEDKSKVIRVLNLWQKNQVFAPDVIQPLFDLADPNHPIYKELGATVQSNGLGNTSLSTSIAKGSPALQKTPTKVPQQGTSEATNLPQHGANPTGQLDQNTLAQLQQLHKLLIRQTGDATVKTEGQQVHFDRKLLDFDYGDDEEEDAANPSPKTATAAPNPIESVGNLLSNPEVLRQLQTLQNSLLQHGTHTEVDLEKLRKLQEMKQQEEEFDKHLAQTVPNLPFAAECEFKPNTNPPAVIPGYFLPSGADMTQPPPGYHTNQSYEIAQPHEEGTMESEVEFVSGGNDNDVEVITLDHGDSRSPSPRDERYNNNNNNRRRRSRSRERSRERNRDRRSRRSRSRSRSRSRRHRSRSREKDRDREKDREREKEREKEKERKKRGLPPVKKDHLSVCSTTLWVGHLSKLVHQEDLSDTFGEFGGIVSIDLIIPRGCAFIVMDRRQDAARCLTKLKNHKLHGKALTLAWAPGKGVKGKDLKDYWEGDLGVSYIPYTKIKPDTDLDMLEDGGMIDEETMPQFIKTRLQSSAKSAPVIENTDSSSVSTSAVATASSTTVDTTQPPPVPSGLLQAPPIPLPMVPPFRSLLGPVAMNLPPIMPNVPIGVPPPTLSASLLPSQLLGINSPFSQAPPSLLQQPIPPMPPMSSSSSDSKNQDSNERNPLLSLPPQPFNMMSQPPAINPGHEDNMDVEMEDADKIERPPALTDELIASINSYSGSSVDVNLNLAVNRLHSTMNQNHRPNPGGLGDDNRRERRDDRNRSRERDRDRNRDRGRRSSHDRHRDGRSGDRRDERRERSNRWSDNRDPDRERDDRRDREKRLNDRLREMANDGVYPPPPLPSNRDRNDSADRHMYPPPDFNGGVDANIPEAANIGEMDVDGDFMRQENFDDGHRMRRPPMQGEFPSRIDRSSFDMDRNPDFERPPPFDGPPEFDRPPNFDGPPPFEGPPDFDGPPNFERPPNFDRPPNFEGPPDFEGPPEFDEPPPFDEPQFDDPRDYDGPRSHMQRDGNNYMRRDRFPDDDMGPDDFGGRPPRMNGPPPNFFPPPRDSFGPPRGPPMMRGPRPDRFAPRGMMGRPMFHPRGPHMRGPRPGPPWMMDGGMRPNFPPRFDGPPNYNRGGPPGPHHFDDFHPRNNRRFDDRRWFPKSQENDNTTTTGNELFERNERKSRWSNRSPTTEPEEAATVNQGGGENVPEESNESFNNFENMTEGNTNDNVQEESSQGRDEVANTTPLRDEEQSHGATESNSGPPDVSETNESDLTLNADTNENAEQE